MIFGYGAQGAALGFVLLLVAASAAVPIGIWGAALGIVVLHLRGRSSEPKILFWVALPPHCRFAVVGSQIWRPGARSRGAGSTRHEQRRARACLPGVAVRARQAWRARPGASAASREKP